MSKLKFCFFLKIIFLFSISTSYSSQINQFCNSKIGSSNKPNKIEYIEVKINKSRKWVKNLSKAYLSPSRTIENKFKKRFKSKLIVFFKDGSKCEFKTRTRLNGDFRDHIQIVDNQIISSMNINILGHLNNSTQIKLLLDYMFLIKRFLNFLKN